MKKGNSINETLILLQQDIRGFYGVAPHEMKSYGKVNHSIKKARIAFCYFAYILSPNSFSSGMLTDMINKSQSSIREYIRKGQSLDDLKQLKSHLRTQGWKI